MAKGKNKLKYSVRQNLKYLLKDYWGWKPSLIWTGLLYIPLAVIVPLLIALVPKIIIDVIEQGGGMNQLLWVVPVLVACMILIYIAERLVMLYVNDSGSLTMFRYMVAIDVKTMEVDYEYIAGTKGKTQREKAWKMIRGGGASYLYIDVVYLALNLIGLLSYGGVLATLHPVILVILAVSYLITWYINKKINAYIQSRRDEEAEVSKGLRYLIRNAMDLAGAKDIRLYGIQGWFKQVGEALIQKEDDVLKDVAKRQLGSAIVSALLVFVRDGAAYALLIYKVIQGEVSVSNFLVYFTMISTFANWISGVLSNYTNLDLDNRGFGDFREFMDHETTVHAGNGAKLPAKEQWPVDIELRNVSFTYAEADEPTIRNVNLKFKAGERIALVGLNGAGKTTLVKLICGLLHPTEGEILIGGVKAADFARDEYFKLFSVIFQDVHLLPISIAGNIILQQEEQYDRERLQTCLQLSGLMSKIERLPEGLNTLMVKNVNEEAVELSGGEMQKLLLARALYKEAPVLILDEPTAALDPIAENELYLQYRDMTQDRTSLFISHRFASTRFCDRIVLMEQGRVLEEGTHEQLMEQDGRYAELFNVQSRYYQEGGEANE